MLRFLQRWPRRRIRPSRSGSSARFPAGGGTDLTSRLLGEQLHKSLGQPVVVDNRTGASGMIGTGAAAKAPPDGYTLLVASGEMAVNPHLYKKMAYDWDKDLQPITLLVKVPNVMAVNMDVPVKTVGELIAYAKQNARQAHVLLERRRQSAAADRRAVQQDGRRARSCTCPTRAPRRSSRTSRASTSR